MSRRAAGPVVLLVDDSEADLESFGAALSAHGYALETAANGLQGLRSALKLKPNVIVTDVEMPGMDGWTLLRMVRARKEIARTPIVFLTRLSGDQERLRGYQLGVDDYIGKESPPEEVLARLKRLLRRASEPPRVPVGAERLLRGDLLHVTLGNLLTFLEMEGKTGVLSLADAGRTAHLYFRQGAPVRSSIGRSDLGARQQMFEILGWAKGEFEFVAQEVPPETADLRVKVIELLLDYARMTDEARR